MCLVVVNLVAVQQTSPSTPTLSQPDAAVTVLESDPVGHHVALMESQDADDDQLWLDIIGKLTYIYLLTHTYIHIHTRLIMFLCVCDFLV